MATFKALGMTRLTLALPRKFPGASPTALARRQASEHFPIVRSLLQSAAQAAQVARLRAASLSPTSEPRAEANDALWEFSFRGGTPNDAVEFWFVTKSSNSHPKLPQ